MQAGLWHVGPIWLARSRPSTGGALATTPRTSAEPHAISSATTEISSEISSERMEHEEARLVVLDEAAAERALRSDVEIALRRDASLAEGISHNDSRALIRLHKVLDTAWRRRVLGLLSIALARNRTAVLPPAWCFCDLYWGGMSGCRAIGAMSTALPFECPVDHIIDVARWSTQARLSWRPPRWLEHHHPHRHRHHHARHQRRSQRQQQLDAGRTSSQPWSSQLDAWRKWHGGTGEEISEAISEEISEESSHANVQVVSLSSLPTARCEFTSPARAVDRTFALELLRYSRLFCYTEGRSARAGDAAPCCTEHSLRSAWTTDDDPRGKGFLPCDWGFQTPEDALAECARHGARHGRSEKSAQHGAVDARDGATEANGRRDLDLDLDLGGQSGAAHVILAVCSLPQSPNARSAEVSTSAELSASAEVQLLHQWAQTALKARGSADALLILAASDGAIHVAQRLGLQYKRLPRASSWAGSVAACVHEAGELLLRHGQPLVLSMPSVQWWVDPGPWLRCDGPTAGSLQCSPLGPADAMVATEMLSVRL